MPDASSRHAGQQAGPEGMVTKLGRVLRGLGLVCLLAGPGLAFGQDGADDGGETASSEPPPRTTITTATPPPDEDALPIPTLSIDRVPPRTSFEFAVQVSYGQVAYFTDAVPAWLGFGVRGAWGRNLGKHRLGFGATATAEGDFGVHTLLALEPSVNWDYVSAGGVLLGVGAGPSGMYTRRNATTETESSFELAPTAVARIGWSQTWSRVGRRLFVFLEPKVRFTAEGMTPVVAIAIGSGRGR